MACFDLYLQSSTQCEKMSHIVSFVGEDASGLFGILAQHTQMMTCLHFGLAWFRYDNNETEYLALPGAILYFKDNQLFLATRHYVRHKEYQAIQHILENELKSEADHLISINDSLHRLDEEMLQRLWNLKRQNAYEI